jgi:hypothetical protein
VSQGSVTFGQVGYNALVTVDLGATDASSGQPVPLLAPIRLSVTLSGAQLTGQNPSLARLYESGPGGSWIALPTSNSSTGENRTLSATISQLGIYVAAAPSAGARVPLVYIPSVQGAPIVQNGGFEGDFSGWQTGGSLGVSISTSDVHSGQKSALLGNPAYDCNGGVPIAEAYVAQTVTLPATSNPTLSFWYRLFTQDLEKGPTTGLLYDSFDVYVNNLDDPSHLLFRAANTDQSKSGCDKPTIDFGWKQGTASLASYARQRVTLYFVVETRVDNYLNTWAYLDDVAITNP